MFEITVQELQLAARAAERWPAGMNGGHFVSDDELDFEFREREQIEIDRVIGYGCPATEIAARRAKERGETVVTGDEVETIFGHLISQFYSEIERKPSLTLPSYIDLLTNSPGELSRQLRMLAEGRQ